MIICRRPGQRFGTDGFPGLPSHNNGMIPCKFFEVFQVIGEMPDQVIVLSDDMVICNRSDRSEGHTATAPLICGCAS